MPNIINGLPNYVYISQFEGEDVGNCNLEFCKTFDYAATFLKNTSGATFIIESGNYNITEKTIGVGNGQHCIIEGVSKDKVFLENIIDTDDVISASNYMFNITSDGGELELNEFVYFPFFGLEKQGFFYGNGDNMNINLTNLELDGKNCESSADFDLIYSNGGGGGTSNIFMQNIAIYDMITNSGFYQLLDLRSHSSVILDNIIVDIKNRPDTDLNLEVLYLDSNTDVNIGNLNINRYYTSTTLIECDSLMILHNE